MQGTFYVVGVGPGDSELLTLRAVRILQRCDIWFVPSAFENGESMALKIVSGEVNTEGKTILAHHFPMKLVHRGKEPAAEVAAAWKEAAAIVVDHLRAGNDVVFPTLGDPAIYSTGYYVCETLQQSGADIKIEIIPGVSAIGASSAAAGLPLCLGDERLVVIPATFENGAMREVLAQSDTIVFMKVHKVMPKIVRLLGDLDLLDKAVLVERSSFGDQKIWTDIRAAVDRDIHYFSTILVRKK